MQIILNLLLNAHIELNQLFIILSSSLTCILMHSAMFIACSSHYRIDRPIGLLNYLLILQSMRLVIVKNQNLHSAVYSSTVHIIIFVNKVFRTNSILYRLRRFHFLSKYFRCALREAENL